VSRCTSRPATRSRIRFTASPPRYGLEAAGEDQVEADAGVRARSDSPWSPGVLAPDSSTHSRLQATIGDHTGSHYEHFIRLG
jgi:hypothetical protein